MHHLSHGGHVAVAAVVLHDDVVCGHDAALPATPPRHAAAQARHGAGHGPGQGTGITGNSVATILSDHI